MSACQQRRPSRLRRSGHEISTPAFAPSRLGRSGREITASHGVYQLRIQIQKHSVAFGCIFPGTHWTRIRSFPLREDRFQGHPFVPLKVIGYTSTWDGSTWLHLAPLKSWTRIRSSFPLREERFQQHPSLQMYWFLFRGAET